jgi:hypothetical protein
MNLRARIGLRFALWGYAFRWALEWFPWIWKGEGE